MNAIISAIVDNRALLTLVAIILAAGAKGKKNTYGGADEFESLRHTPFKDLIEKAVQAAREEA